VILVVAKEEVAESEAAGTTVVDVAAGKELPGEIVIAEDVVNEVIGETEAAITNFQGSSLIWVKRMESENVPLSI
jgi:adenine deaminase